MEQKRRQSCPFYGFYLELLTVRALAGITISDYPSGVRYVLGKGIEAVRYKIPDPSGLGSQVDGLAGVNSVAEGVSRFQTAHSRAVKAEELANRGRVQVAFEEWRKVFGDYFPAYG